ncbi:S-adenosyl-L-methionine-dependent methyltransferases superfamily protein [Euphorbia peplus]|nr:S-adenosyl-L-methionine-dependent methyltransferases superfamily protein [Euphorbia peplus]
MEKHVENLLHKISIACISIATLLLLVILRTPQTCVPPNTPITKPHLKFPSTSCDPSLNRPHLSLAKKNQRLWSSKSWLTKLSSFKAFFSHFQHHNLLHNHSRVLCVSAGAGHEVMALNQLGVTDVTGVELVDSLPLVSKADPTNLPFFDGVFDFAFTAHLTEALFPARFAGEMERTVRRSGTCVVTVDQCGDKEVGDFVSLFRNSTFVGAQNVTLIGEKVTRITLRVGVSSTS